jgi:hydroxymethylpyrimidine/phosphomethylpyrimidine kinase
VSRPYTVLTIAGSDSSGGAGIQADLKTIAALGGYGMSAITALTAQNTQGVAGVHAPDPEFLRLQITTTLSDIPADAVKIGMLHSAEIVAVVADCLKRFQPRHVVLDPVMVATSGDKLITPNTQEEIVRQLFPLATVITPNLDELSWLTGTTVATADGLEDAGQRVIAMGAPAVLVKGGHLNDDILTDLLLLPSGQTIGIRAPRIATRNLHGTGCTLSAAIACHLAMGEDLTRAVHSAHGFVQAAIRSSATRTLGSGHGPLDHGFAPRATHSVPTPSAPSLTSGDIPWP